MKKRLSQLLSLVLVIATIICTGALSANADSKSDLKNQIAALEKQSESFETEIKSLQAKANDQAALKKAIQGKIDVIQQQVNACNSEISKINSSIAANKAEIDKKNTEIEADKLSFKKRIRAIYMSSTDSNVQVLMGAESFSDFLQLSQLTASVSAHDKVLIEKIVAAIEVLQVKQTENENLLKEQVSIKNTVAAKQEELKAEQAKIQAVINDISSDKSAVEADNKKTEADLKKLKQDYENLEKSFLKPEDSGGSNIKLPNIAFAWPVSGFYYISAGFMSNDSVHNGKHNGIDIAGGGISGQPVLAIADGYVSRSNSGASVGDYSAGGGFGNYVQIDHGTLDGNRYQSIYGHMSSIAVGTGSSVKKGQVVGYVGTTGWSTGYHLHLGISINGAWVNPMRFYSKVQ